MSGTGAAIDTRALEAVLFVSDEPLTPAVLSQALEVDRRTVDDLCDRLQAELSERGSGLVLRNVAGGAFAMAVTYLIGSLLGTSVG